MQVLIIDSNNIAALGDFQRKEWGFKNYTYKAAFADHLKYLNALADGPQERYAVFDNVKVAIRKTKCSVYTRAIGQLSFFNKCLCL